MQVGDLVRHTMKSHTIYGGHVGLIVAVGTLPAGARCFKIKWLGLPKEFEEVYNLIALPEYSLVLVEKKDTNV